MKAIAVFPETKEIHVVEHPEPQIEHPEQVKLRLLEVGVCGTDRHICALAFGTPPAHSEYLILGHEALAEVVAVGEAVTHLQPGDLVVPEVRRPCADPACRACQASHQDFCQTGTYTERGIKELHGYMAEYVVDDVHFLHPVPKALSQVAVLTEPLTIAEKALVQALQIQQRLPWQTSAATSAEPGSGLTAVVLGAGPIGLLGAMLFVIQGFDTYVYSRAQTPNDKADIVAAIGATYISAETTPMEAFKERVGQIDLVYEAMDAAPLAIEVLQNLNRNGIFIFTSGTNPKQPFGIDSAATLHNLTPQNQIIIGTVNAGPATFQSAIEHLGVFQQRWPAILPRLITERYPMERASEVLLQKPGGIKHVVTIG
ncbi:glucose 1-dehydrogenase [Dictyobacter formicarum]|uniref:Alcohol dehydrogenase n=1 Tax=Dictyobacter formicarum TaxID=2778368 RepID=A0ABQ3VBQ3_9CHLR|nr:glucose 1-dehydrogenase [Dictyobacter formicarum]GHO83332.1 alcohol dehydrogenase [Dictyobacter formicarum]